MCKFIYGAIAFICFTQSAYADRPCPPPPCSGPINSEKKICSEKADWIVEGTVSSVKNGVVEHNSYIGGSIVKGEVWDRGLVEIGDIVLIKGSFPKLESKVSLQGASHCWFQSARVPEEWIGKRIKAYGISDYGSVNYGPWVHQGIFALELLSK